MYWKVPETPVQGCSSGWLRLFCGLQPISSPYNCRFHPQICPAHCRHSPKAPTGGTLPEPHCPALGHRRRRGALGPPARQWATAAAVGPGAARTSMGHHRCLRGAWGRPQRAAVKSLIYIIQKNRHHRNSQRPRPNR